MSIQRRCAFFARRHESDKGLKTKPSSLTAAKKVSATKKAKEHWCRGFVSGDLNSTVAFSSTRAKLCGQENRPDDKLQVVLDCVAPLLLNAGHQDAGGAVKRISLITATAHLLAVRNGPSVGNEIFNQKLVAGRLDCQ